MAQIGCKIEFLFVGDEVYDVCSRWYIKRSRLKTCSYFGVSVCGFFVGFLGGVYCWCCLCVCVCVCVCVWSV